MLISFSANNLWVFRDLSSNQLPTIIVFLNGNINLIEMPFLLLSIIKRKKMMFNHVSIGKVSPFRLQVRWLMITLNTFARVCESSRGVDTRKDIKWLLSPVFSSIRENRNHAEGMIPFLYRTKKAGKFLSRFLNCRKCGGSHRSSRGCGSG